MINDMEIIESTTGYSCPMCGCVCSEHSFKSKTDTILEYYPDIHYAWDEIHICCKCGIEYLIHNGT